MLFSEKKALWFMCAVKRGLGCLKVEGQCRKCELGMTHEWVLI